MLTPQDSSPDSFVEPAQTGSEAVWQDACDELERRIRAGETVRAEEYLIRHPNLDAEQALDLIYAEYAARLELGEPPPREELLKRFPQWSSQLQRQFQLDELLDESPVTPTMHTEPAGSRFRVVRLLARGGIGQVMRAIDTELNREVAVKELQPAHAENEDVRERFLREAEITGKLEHPGIVPVYGLGRDRDGRPFYAMRLVHGQTFEEATGKFHQHGDDSQQFAGVEFQKLLRRFLHVCETVAYAHSRGIVHRDLKPANILLGPFGETLVVDWGLARSAGVDGPQIAGSLATPVAHWSNELTQVSGELIGTPAFMSPEQATGAAHNAGPACDVYSLGATLYMLLTGQAPFSATEVHETLRQVVSGSFARPHAIKRSIPRALEAICLKAMSRRPADRYGSPRELADELERWLADEPVKAAPESVFTRLARWGRRHRAHVVASSVALLFVTIVSLAAAVRINTERLRADRERVEANRRSARLAFDRAFGMTAENEHGAALLWFARALSHAPPSDTALRRVILTNMDAVQRHLLRRTRRFGHADPVSAWAFSADGQRLLTSNGGGGWRLWDVEKGKVLNEHSLPRGRVLAVGTAADGSAIVVKQQEFELLVYRADLESLEHMEAPVVIRHEEGPAIVVLHPRGNLLATASRAAQSAKLRIWQVGDGKLVAEFDYHSRVNQLVFQPGTDVVATASVDGRVRLWAASAKRPIQEFMAAGSSIRRFTFTPDGQRLLAGDTAGCVSCWDAANGRRLFDLARHSGAVTSVVCATDGQTVAAAWDTGTTRTWNLETRLPAGELLRLDRFTANLAFRPGSRQLMIATPATDFVLWDLPNLEREFPLLNQRQIEAIAFDHIGQIAVTGSVNGTARLRDGRSGKVFGKILRHQGPVKRVVFRPDDAVVLTASSDGTARLWKTTNGDAHGQPLVHRSRPDSTVQVSAAAFSPDGHVIATGDNAGTIRTWNGDTGELIRELDDVRGTVSSVRFSPRGDILAAGLGDPEHGVQVWDVASGDRLWKGAHREAVRTIAFSPDGLLLISGSNDDTARFWDVKSGQPIGRELVHRGEVFTVGFSPNGKLAVTGGYDATVRLWEVPSGEPIGEPMQHEGIVMAAAFSTDGIRLLTGSADCTARLWDVTTCLPVSPPLPHQHHVAGIGMNPSCDLALTGRVWPLPKPLPDDPGLIDIWTKLATERAFAGGDNIEWLDGTALDDLAREFESRAGMSWTQWAARTRELTDLAALEAGSR